MSPNLYIPSTIKTQINLAPVCLRAEWADRTVLEIYAILALLSCCFHIFMSKTDTNLEFLYIDASAQKS
jgi:hypothetical protein